MIPHIIVWCRARQLQGYNGYWFFGRPTPEDLRQDLPAVTHSAGQIGISQHRKGRRHGRRAAKRSFYPYGKTYTPTLGEQD